MTSRSRDPSHGTIVADGVRGHPHPWHPLRLSALNRSERKQSLVGALSGIGMEKPGVCAFHRMPVRGTARRGREDARDIHKLMTESSHCQRGNRVMCYLCIALTIYLPRPCFGKTLFAIAGLLHADIPYSDGNVE